jgi:hypothetical protein
MTLVATSAAHDSAVKSRGPGLIEDRTREETDRRTLEGPAGRELLADLPRNEALAPSRRRMRHWRRARTSGVGHEHPDRLLEEGGESGARVWPTTVDVEDPIADVAEEVVDVVR